MAIGILLPAPYVLETGTISAMKQVDLGIRLPAWLRGIDYCKRCSVHLAVDDRLRRCIGGKEKSDENA